MYDRSLDVNGFQDALLHVSIEPIKFHNNYRFASVVVDVGGGKLVCLARLNLTLNLLKLEFSSSSVIFRNTLP